MVKNMKLSTTQILAISLFPIGYIAFLPVYQKSTVPHVEYLLACAGMTMIFCMLFFPSMAKLKLFAWLDWTKALTNGQMEAYKEIDLNKYRTHSDGYFNRVKPYMFRLLAVIILLMVIHTFLFATPVKTVNLESYVGMSFLTVIFYFLGVISILMISVYFSFEKSKK